jgi:segregation and condensation protein A
LVINNYVIEINDFSGPANLLLELVRKRKIDIYNIRLAAIIQDFIDYINKNKNVLLDTITSFIYVAAILLEIKSSSVIPSQRKNFAEDEDLPDSEALALREKKYRIFLKISNYISRLKSTEELYFIREAPVETQFLDAMPDFLKNLSIENLNFFASKLLGRSDFTLDLSTVYMEDASITILDAMEKIKKAVIDKKEVSFKDIADNYDLLVDKIVCFLSMLELYKNEVIDIIQFENFGDIIIRKMK